MSKSADKNAASPLLIGWGSADITPPQPVLIFGQFHGRLPEEPAEPLTATALVLDDGATRTALISCDLESIFAPFEPAVRQRIIEAVPELAGCTIIINATHTHTAPEIVGDFGYFTVTAREKIKLPVMRPDDVRDYIAGQVAKAVKSAWQSRRPGKVAWGLDFAVVGRNRRWVSTEGKATMYGNIGVPEFSHIEGFEDHSVNVLATYDSAGAATGVAVNIACPSQVRENDYRYSPDFWHETRQLLRQRYGDALFVLPQCSAGGDQSPRPFYDRAALERMERLRGQDQRLAIATRLTRAVSDTIDAISVEATAAAPLAAASKTVTLPLNRLSDADAKFSARELAGHEAARDAEIERLAANPELLNEPRWYINLTKSTQYANWHRGVVQRYKELQQNPAATRDYVIHAVRVGDIAFLSNPFELYLDYAIRIKARSPFLQTFVIQLAGSAAYLSTRRSTLAGGYGSIPPSTPIGPEGGNIFTEVSLDLLKELHGE